MSRCLSRILISLAMPGLLLSGCAGGQYLLMPTPSIYDQVEGMPVFTADMHRPQGSGIDLLYLTDRAPETGPASDLPYGQERSDQIAFGSARVRIAPELDWQEVRAQSRLARRTERLPLSLGEVREIGRYPPEPYNIVRRANGEVHHEPEELRQHHAANRALRAELKRRLALSSSKRLVLYVHGFNETFATAAFTIAELCHFLGREDVCAFFTWPASSTGFPLISYTSTTESAQYAVADLKKVIRTLALTPDVSGVELLAHSRGAAVTLAALRELFLEAVVSGREPVHDLKIDNLILFSPDVDATLAGRSFSDYISDPDIRSHWPEKRLPRALGGRLTIYTSPRDRALSLSSMLFRGDGRLGHLGLDDFNEDHQRYYSKLGNIDIVVYQGRRTDFFGHRYFTSNPAVSSDVIRLLRFGDAPGDPRRGLVGKGPLLWTFPEGP